MKDLNAIVAYKMLEMVKQLLTEHGEKDVGKTNDAASEFTYSSKQATHCAGCGKYKHTPLRNDTMGGYVCLTCIDRELVRLQESESTES